MEWKIYLVNPFHPKLKLNNTQYVLGSCDTLNKKIYINKQVSYEEYEKILYHELTHAILSSYNINLNIYEKETIADLAFKVQNIIKRMGIKY